MKSSKNGRSFAPSRFTIFLGTVVWYVFILSERVLQPKKLPLQRPLKHYGLDPPLSVRGEEMARDVAEELTEISFEPGVLIFYAYSQISSSFRRLSEPFKLLSCFERLPRSRCLWSPGCCQQRNRVAR